LKQYIGKARRGAAPSNINSPLPLIEGDGVTLENKDIKRVPGKIADFPGCLKGIGLINVDYLKGCQPQPAVKPLGQPLLLYKHVILIIR
jgi:hypothetical protein